VTEMPEWVVLRYGLLYGPDTWYAPDGLRADEARAGRLAADADVSSFVHADDAANAAVEALEWPSGIVNVCDDEPASGREWVPVFCAAVGAPPPEEGDGARAPWARGASNARARGDLGWTPQHPSWRQGFHSDARSTT
jgi:nucleoside-diphosphate-sugar epimerase